jgi:hypothetical protein
MVGVASLVLATTRISALGLGSGSSQPEARGANRLRANCKRLSGDSAPAPALPNLQRSGHQAAVTPGGVTRSRVVGEVALPHSSQSDTVERQRRLPDPHSRAEVQHRSCAWDEDQACPQRVSRMR